MVFRDAAVIAGVAEIAPVRDPAGATVIDFLARVARGAMLDAGLVPADIDGLVIGPSFAGAPLTMPAIIGDVLGIRPAFCDVVDLGGATAAGMVWRAAAAIASGAATAVLCALAEATDQRNPVRGVPWPGMPGLEWERAYGPMGANTGYAMAAMRHAHLYGTTDAQRARVAVDQRTNACANPASQFFGRPITIDDVLSSPLVCDPLHLLEIVMPSSGGTAFVVTTPQIAKQSGKANVSLLGFGERVTHSMLASIPDLTTTAIADSAAKAFAMAGVKPSDVDMLSIYDCYTITVIITLEDAGFCAKGSGGSFVADHDLTWRGDLPVNTHGGQLSYGQAGLAGGASHITEAVRQLRGEATGRQVDNCELVFVHGNGGLLSEQCSLVLARQP